MVSDQSCVSCKVVILSDDVVVGRALELLLQNVGHEVKFMMEGFLVDSKMLKETRLLIFAPCLCTERRQALFIRIKSLSSTKTIPILELTFNPQAVKVGSGHFVAPWPCTAEELKSRIRAALHTADCCSADHALLSGNQENP